MPCSSRCAKSPASGSGEVRANEASSGGCGPGSWDRSAHSPSRTEAMHRLLRQPLLRQLGTNPPTTELKRLLAGLAAGLVLGGGVAGAATFVIDNNNQVRPIVANWLGSPSLSLIKQAQGTVIQLHNVGEQGVVAATCPIHYGFIDGPAIDNSRGMRVESESVSQDLRTAYETVEFVDDTNSYPLGEVAIGGWCYPVRP